VLLGDCRRQNLGLAALERQPRCLLGEGTLGVAESRQRAQHLHDLPEGDLVERPLLLRRVSEYGQDARPVVVHGTRRRLLPRLVDHLPVQVAAVFEP
jgi:hypothetical protein